MYRENPKLASNPKFRLAGAKLAIAPHVGARIETSLWPEERSDDIAPHVGARIETLAHSGHDNANVIASLADARIETSPRYTLTHLRLSHLAQVRGLK